MKKILCSRCNKNNAEVFMTSIVNGKKIEEILCLECALQKEEIGLMIKHDSQFQQLIEQAMKMKNMDFDKVVNLDKKMDRKKIVDLDLPEDCPVCGAGVEQITETGLAGCSYCYKIFEQEMDALLGIKRVTTFYKGRTPQNLPQEDSAASQLIILKQKLQDSINKEEYEEANLIKEQIVKLEKR